MGKKLKIHLARHGEIASGPCLPPPKIGKYAMKLSQGGIFSSSVEQSLTLFFTGAPGKGKATKSRDKHGTGANLPFRKKSVNLAKMYQL